ncbi:MAG: antibiotic biosynthesis monooxygenase family protein [Desulfosarcina sp.]
MRFDRNGHLGIHFGNILYGFGKRIDPNDRPGTVGRGSVTLLFVKMNVLAEKRKEVLQTINSLSADIKKEQGYVDSKFFQNAADETEILFLTTWADRNALEAYLKSVKFTVLLGIRSLLREEPTINICEGESFCRRGG